MRVYFCGAAIFLRVYFSACPFSACLFFCVSFSAWLFSACLSSACLSSAWLFFCVAIFCVVIVPCGDVFAWLYFCMFGLLLLLLLLCCYFPVWLFPHLFRTCISCIVEHLLENVFITTLGFTTCHVIRPAIANNNLLLLSSEQTRWRTYAQRQEWYNRNIAQEMTSRCVNLLCRFADSISICKTNNSHVRLTSHKSKAIRPVPSNHCIS